MQMMRATSPRWPSGSPDTAESDQESESICAVRDAVADARWLKKLTITARLEKEQNIQLVPQMTLRVLLESFGFGAALETSN